MERVPYDDFAEIYDAWLEAVPVAEEMRSFYVELMVESAGPVVELGVGNGRISVEVARRGKPVVGIDSSSAILDLCAQRARAAGVAERLELIQADFRDFQLAVPADLIALPFHSIGHLPTEEDKRRCMARVREQLAAGGRFVWDTTTRDPDRQMIEVLVRIEDLDPAGVVEKARYASLELSWIDPGRSRQLLEECGFEIEALYGDFSRGSFEQASSHQVWVARRA